MGKVVDAEDRGEVVVARTITWRDGIGDPHTLQVCYREGCIVLEDFFKHNDWSGCSKIEIPPEKVSRLTRMIREIEAR